MYIDRHKCTFRDIKFHSLLYCIVDSVNSMTETNSLWHVKLYAYHFNFFKELAKEIGDTERGAEARQCRKFLSEQIIEHKRKVVET